MRGPLGLSRTLLQRLRTQIVDVDKSNRPCKERQATVICQRLLITAQTNGTAREQELSKSARTLPWTTWAAAEYNGADMLCEALEGLGIASASDIATAVVKCK